MSAEHAASSAGSPGAWRASLGGWVVAVVACGDAILVALGEGEVVALDPGTGRQRLRVRTGFEGLHGLAAGTGGPDEARFAACGASAEVPVWSATGTPLARLSHPAGTWVEHVAFAPAGDLLATAAGRVVRIFDREGACVRELDPLPATVSALAWRDDGSALAACAYGGVWLWPFTARARARHLTWKGSLIGLAWSPDGKVVACASQDRSVHFWRLANGEDSEIRGYPVKPAALAWDHASKLLAVAAGTTPSIWDFRGKGPEGTRPLQLEGHAEACSRLAFARRSDHLVSGARDGEVILWNPRRAPTPLGRTRVDGGVTALAWLPRGGVALAGSARGEVVAWPVPGAG